MYMSNIQWTYVGEWYPSVRTSNYSEYSHYDKKKVHLFEFTKNYSHISDKYTYFPLIFHFKMCVATMTWYTLLYSTKVTIDGSERENYSVSNIDQVIVGECARYCKHKKNVSILIRNVLTWCILPYDKHSPWILSLFSSTIYISIVFYFVILFPSIKFMIQLRYVWHHHHH